MVKQGLKIGRQGPDNFTEHDFYMVKNRASLRTTSHSTFYRSSEKFLEEENCCGDDRGVVAVGADYG